MPGSGGKILIMDFDLEIVAGSQYDPDDKGLYTQQLAERWIPDPNNPSNGPTFARHYKKANVLFTDGSVKLMSIPDIHPAVVRNQIKYWDPKHE
jgi:prepilin-type processing-associated H-X9-DG protein